MTTVPPPVQKRSLATKGESPAVCVHCRVCTDVWQYDRAIRSLSLLVFLPE
jgi:hypothetical protein